jgi:predicted  nucleic acid-binding Zn-ribbon protein
VEGSQWRDKVRNAEAEVEKFKTDIADKLKKLQDLQKQVASYSQDISLKESKLNEAQELIKKVSLLNFVQFMKTYHFHFKLVAS